MEAYTISSTDTTLTGYYVSRLVPDNTGYIADFWSNLSDYKHLNTLLAWYCASQVAMVLQNDKAAKYCMDMFINLIKTYQL
jgi:hypothetical protein